MTENLLHTLLLLTFLLFASCSSSKDNPSPLFHPSDDPTLKAPVDYIHFTLSQDARHKYILILEAETLRKESEVVFTLDGKELLPGTKTVRKDLKHFNAYYRYPVETSFEEVIARTGNTLRYSHFKGGTYCASIKHSTLSDCIRITAVINGTEDNDIWLADYAFYYVLPQIDFLNSFYGERCQDGNEFRGKISPQYARNPNGNPLVYRVDEFTPRDKNGNSYDIALSAPTCMFRTIKPIEYEAQKSEHHSTISMCELDEPCGFCYGVDCSEEQRECYATLQNCLAITMRFRCYPHYELKEMWEYDTAENDTAQDIVIDSKGFLFITGEIDNETLFVEKRTREGEKVWRKEWSEIFFVQPNEMTIDASGNLYIVGGFKGELNGKKSAETDAFVLKVDSSGKEVWTVAYGNSLNDFARAVTLDTTEETLYVGLDKFDNDYAARIIVFNAKTGSLVNEISWTNGTSERLFDLQVDKQNNIILTGKVYEGEYNGDQRLSFLAKLDSQGNKIWSKLLDDDIAAMRKSSGRAVIVQENGDIMLAGDTNNCVEEEGSRCVFIAKFDEAGSLLWKKITGSEYDDYVSDMFADKYGKYFYITISSERFVRSFVAQTTAEENGHFYFFEPYEIENLNIYSLYGGATWYNEDQDVIELFLTGSTYNATEEQQTLGGRTDTFLLRMRGSSSYGLEK